MPPISEILEFVAAIAPIVGVAIGFLRTLPHRALNHPSAKRLRSENYKLLDMIDNLSPMMHDAKKRQDILAQDILADERKHIICQFSKQMSVRYISIVKSNSIMIALYFFYALVSALLFNTSSQPIWAISILICALFILGHLFFLMLGLPFWKPVKFLKGRKLSTLSEKEGFFLSIDRAQNCYETTGQYHMVDARPYVQAFRLPLIDSVRAFDDPLHPLERNVTNITIKTLQKAIPDKEQLIFICSEFGVESHELAAKLRDSGYGNAYDLGEIATRYALFQRLAYQLHYLTADKL